MAPLSLRPLLRLHAPEHVLLSPQRLAAASRDARPLAVAYTHRLCKRHMSFPRRAPSCRGDNCRSAEVCDAGVVAPSPASNRWALSNLGRFARARTCGRRRQEVVSYGRGRWPQAHLFGRKFAQAPNATPRRRKRIIDLHFALVSRSSPGLCVAAALTRWECRRHNLSF